MITNALILFILFVLIASIIGIYHKKQALRQFRRNIHEGDICSIHIDGVVYTIEIEDVIENTVYYILHVDSDRIFNQMTHINYIYPYKHFTNWSV